MTELTRILGVERPGLSGLVDRVQQRGLVERQGVPHDRRAVMLTLTPGGKRITEEFYAEVSDQLQHLVAGLPAAERHRFETIGSKILATERVSAVFGSGTAQGLGDGALLSCPAQAKGRVLGDA